MNLFINDVFIKITSTTALFSVMDFDAVFTASQIPQIPLETLQGTLAISNTTGSEIKQLIGILEKNQQVTLQKIVLFVDDEEKIKEYLKNNFKIIEAAGGIVTHQKKYLMMFRRKKWDLPKGKKDGNETSRQTALREIHEECGIHCSIVEKITNTYHNYRQGGELVLKKTHWYWLTTQEPDKIKPQYEEDIEELLWTSDSQRKEALKNTFGSIKYILEHFQTTTIAL